MCNNSSLEQVGRDGVSAALGSLPFDLPRGADDVARSRAARGHNNNASHNDIPLDLTARNELPFADASGRSSFRPIRFKTFSLNIFELFSSLGSNNPVASYVSSRPSDVTGDSFQRLPDFLSDGHVHSSSAAARQPSNNNNATGSASSEQPVELVPGLDVTAAGNSNAHTRSLVNLQLENSRSVDVLVSNK